MSKRDRRRRKRQKKQGERKLPPPERHKSLEGDLLDAALEGDVELFHRRLDQDALYEERRRRPGGWQ